MNEMLRKQILKECLIFLISWADKLTFTKHADSGP